MTNKYGLDEDFDGGIGLVEERWNYPGMGYNLSTGRLYFKQEKVDKLEVTLVQYAEWKEVVIGKGDNERVVGSYHVKTPADQMQKGNVRQRIQVLMLVNGDPYLFGFKNNTGKGIWLKNQMNAKYYPGIATGIWTELVDHINQVKKEDGVLISQLGWKFTIAPSEEQVLVNAEYGTRVYPIVRVSDFGYVGKEQFKKNVEFYKTEEIEQWKESRSNPTGIVITDDSGTHELDDAGEPMMYNEDEAPAVSELEYEDEIPF